MFKLAPVIAGAAQDLGTVICAGGAGLLIWAGAGRTWSPGARGRDQLTGGLEVGLSLLVLIGPGRFAAGVLAATFLLFSAIHLRDLHSGGGGACDCFGPGEQVSPGRALALTGAVAGLAGASAVIGAPSLRQLCAAHPSTLIWTPSAAVALALLWRVGFSGPASLTRLIDVTSALIERAPAENPTASAGGAAMPRRSFLLRVAVFGSAIAAAPLRYALHPGTALAAIVGPGDCVSGDCLDGYTGFCCEITQGQTNTCPTGTFPGGWWMCTDYSGRRLCSDQGVRYYVDCNALPGHPFPGGCRCANDNCNERRVACNVFRYGQCNTQIEGTTAVVCRMVTCENPSTISALQCSASLAVDDSTCGHDVPCLEPRAIELAGAAGA